MNSKLFWMTITTLAATTAILGLTALSAQITRSEPRQNTIFFTAEQNDFYAKEIRPLLAEKCIICHDGGSSSGGGLALTSRAAILKGGSKGAAVNLTRPTESLLVRAIHYKESLKMPPQGQLAQAQIDLLTRWVEMGMPYPAASGADKTPVKKGPPPVNAETMRFWSFRPVKRPPVPAVRQQAWVRNPIDAFVLARLEKAGLKPSPPAGRAALLRRVTYDLIGLPPTPEEIAAFVNDRSPNAYEKVVDRLLASPHYGEKWARRWLDLVRYAETNSFERDDPKPFAWRYRDYVIRSLNQDKPYDRFVREQLAGDELDTVTPETLIATGYYRLGAWDDEPADPDQARYDELDDIVATTGQVFLGLTVNCARCHDHKIDPIPQKDYYRLLSFFQGVTRYGEHGRPFAETSLRPIAPPEEIRKHDMVTAEYQRRLDDLNKQIGSIEKRAQQDFAPVEKEEFHSEQNQIPLVQKRVPRLISTEEFDRYREMRTQRKALLAAPPPSLEQALCVTEYGRTPGKTTVMLRGNPHVPGDEVQPAFLSVLAPPKPAIREPLSNPNSSGRRLALADWIASKDNKLTARVMVNRIWQGHFGRGIVRSPSNFGFLGTPPTHPELLDWLASEFMRNDWKIKPLHKLILMSNTYRMSSGGNPKALARDPENDLLWRFDMRRLDAEEIRDSILAVNGSLNTQTMYGPDIYPTIPKEVLAGQSRPGYGWETSPPDQQNRRSIYIHIKRSLAVPLLASFDMADTDFSCPMRFATTQPTQALGMLNSTFLNEQAGIFATELRKQAGPDPKAQVSLGLRRTLQREPTAPEIARGLKFMTRMQQENGVKAPEVLRLYCVILLNLNEFIYLD
jgi:mono/diheme cytochrome c family protein